MKEYDFENLTDQNYLDILNELIKANGKCINLGRLIKRYYQPLHQWILNKTIFVPETSNYNERIYCIIHNIKSMPLNENGTPARFINLFTGYSTNRNRIRKLNRQEIYRFRLRYGHVKNYILSHPHKNKGLYEDDMIKGYHYVECPVTGVRKNVINDQYIKSVLKMSVEEFDKKYPTVRKVPISAMDHK